MARSVAAFLLAVLVVATVTPMTAADAEQGRAIRLTWKAPPECPSATQVLADARGLVVHQEALEEGAPIAVDGAIVRVAATRWVLTLTVGEARRRLEATTCGDLARAGALFLALLVDPERGGSTAAQTAQAVGPPPPAPTAAASASTASAPAAIAALKRGATVGPEQSADAKPQGAKAEVARPEGARPEGSREVSPLAVAGVLVDVGTLPHAGVFGVIAGGIRIQRLDLTLEVALGRPEDTIVSGSAGARLMAASGTLKPCYRAWRWGRVRLGPCLPIEVGWIHAQGIGIAQSVSSDSAWWSLGGALALWLALGDRVEARVDVTASVPLVRPDFELTGVGRVFEPSAAVRGGSAAVVRF